MSSRAVPCGITGLGRRIREHGRQARPWHRAVVLVALCLFLLLGGLSCGVQVSGAGGAQHKARGAEARPHLAEPGAFPAGRWTLEKVLGSRRFRHASTVVCVAFVGASSRCLSGSCDGAVKLWDTGTGEELRSFSGHQGTVISLAASPDGTRALSAGDDGTIRLWDLAEGRQLRLLGDAGGAVWSVAFTPDGEHCLTGGEDGLIKLWDLTTGALVRTFAGHSGRVSSLALDAEGKVCVSGGLDMTVRVWEVGASGSPGTRAEGFHQTQPQGRGGGTRRPREAERGRERTVLRGHQAPVTGVALSPRPQGGPPRLCASASADGTVRLWDLRSSEAVNVLRASAPVSFGSGTSGVQAAPSTLSVAFSPDGRLCLSGDTAGAATLWDVETGKPVRTFRGHRDAVWSVAFSRDGARCLSGGADCQVRVWDPASGTELLPSAGHQHEVTAVALSPDGTQCLSTSKDGTLKLWDVATGTDTRTLRVSGRFATSVGFLVDPKRCIYVSEDGSLQLLDATRDEQVCLLPGGVEGVSALAVDPEGNQVLAGAVTGTLTLWQLNVSPAGSGTRVTLGGPRQAQPVRPPASRAPGGRPPSKGGNAAAGQPVDAADASQPADGVGASESAGPVSAVALSPGRRLCAAGTAEGVIQVWDVERRELKFAFPGEGSPVIALAFSSMRRGERGAAGGVARVPCHRQRTRGCTGTGFAGARGTRAREEHLLAVRGDGSLLACHVWEGATLEVVRVLAGRPTQAAFSGDGRRLACLTQNGEVQLYDTDSGELSGSIAGEGGPTSIAFSPDGRLLAVGSRDSTVTLYSLQRGASSPGPLLRPAKRSPGLARATLLQGPRAVS